MGKPRMIILIRHAQSEGNKNREIHQRIPDHRVKLTPEGWTQAQDAGRRLRSLLRADDTLHFYTSPYRRTRETTEGILSTLTSDDPSPSPFVKSAIKVYEEPRLREQDFGNFQPCSAEMERMWQERADYGHFFYRIPNGESAADAYDRISGFNESLWRQFGEEDFASVCVLVTHGLMSRVFLMKWYHFSVEYFEDLRNVNHCEFLIMRKEEDTGKYLLETNLRTWSQLEREQLEAARKKAEETPAEKISNVVPRQVLKRKQWGGCPDGCNHGKENSNKENSTRTVQGSSKEPQAGDTIASRRSVSRRWQSSSEEDSDDLRGRILPSMLIEKQSVEYVVSSPSGNLIAVEDHLRTKLKSPLHISQIGRDFGGSSSGYPSRDGSETELSADEQECRHRDKRTSASQSDTTDGTDDIYMRSGMGRGARANALGDQNDGHSDVHSDGVDEAEGMRSEPSTEHNGRSSAGDEIY